MQDRRRTGQRIDTNIKVHYQDSSIPVSSCIFNLSTGGMFIKTNHPLPIDATLSMWFRLPNDDESMNIQGRVVWSKITGNSFPSGMGVQFMEMSPLHKQRIQSFVDTHVSHITAAA